MRQALSNIDLAQALDNAGGVKVVRITHLQKNQLVWRVVWHGQVQQFTMAILDVHQSEIPERPTARQLGKASPLATTTKFRSRSSWTVEQLVEEDLPLYWCEPWLKQEFDRLGSFAKIDQMYGYPETSLSNFASREFGWNVKPRQLNKKQEALQMHAAGKSTREIMDALGIPKGTVNRWFRELK
ncbi:helix-turn-helix domain-containing protein [Deinococcus roseus]|uniref:Helix-turn-helix domain-containing protein n=1 Tax=Deinococcus roseus TaxID=392414 RepID=A0ABQ2D5N8_9DEIO|nr:helix-turn-helix domain-containing protein [Deinococcus roseus]GGJ44586.1 hypothetical protein GCM10008938_33460 [Deinococcus roseus]